MGIHLPLILTRGQVALLLATAMFAVQACAQASNSGTSPQVRLTDPTPRPVDLQQKYSEKGTDAAVRQRTELLNERRRELVGRASAEMVSLATTLNREMSQPQSRASLASEAAAAAEIEKMAKNVKHAVKLP